MILGLLFCRCGRCRLQRVHIQNEGVDWKSKDNVYWQHKVSRLESVKIILHGNSEFEAQDVTLQVNKNCVTCVILWVQEVLENGHDPAPRLVFLPTDFFGVAHTSSKGNKTLFVLSPIEFLGLYINYQRVIRLR